MALRFMMIEHSKVSKELRLDRETMSTRRGEEEGLRYQTCVPRVSIGRLKETITGEQTTPSGWKRKGICVRGDHRHGFLSNGSIREGNG